MAHNKSQTSLLSFYFLLFRPGKMPYIIFPNYFIRPRQSRTTNTAFYLVTAIIGGYLELDCSIKSLIKSIFLS